MATPDLVEMAARVDAWAGDRLPGAGALHVEPLGEGHSNLTFLLRRSGSGEEWVLRRPPSGHVLPTAHDVLREFRILDLFATSGAKVRAPHVELACDDVAVIGAPFYVMQRSPGEVIRSAVPSWLDASRQRTVGIDLLDAMIELHAVPVEPFVAARLGRPDEYVTRQLGRWAAQRDGVHAIAESVGITARELPDYGVVLDWLRAHVPPERAPSVVHGDFKLDNALVDPTTARITALLDWEMATVGDPIADLGYLLAMSAGEGGATFGQLAGLATPLPGLPGQDELLERYADATGRDVTGIGFYKVLAMWKLGILLEASYHRYLAGTTDDPMFPQLEWGVPALLERARALTGA